MAEGKGRASVPLYLAAAVAVLAALALVIAFSLQPKPLPAPQEEPHNPYVKPNRAIECTDGETKECELGDCGGAISCIGGAWGECVPKKRICVPGKVVGCTLDSCNFGYKVCNECGTGFSECMAEIPSAPCSSNCT